jgi:fluoride exporter
MLKWLLIAGGGAFGSVMRYALQGWVQRAAASTFPLGTLVVNVIGCILIGFLTAFLTGPYLVREEYRVGLTVGILGGFTTFSAFGFETFMLASDRQYWFAVLNAVLSCVLGFLAVWIGSRVAVYWHGI